MKIMKDIEEVDMEEFYKAQPGALATRKYQIDQIHIVDQGQSLEYQKKLFHFEKEYLEKLKSAVKEANQDWVGLTRPEAGWVLDRQTWLALQFVCVFVSLAALIFEL